MCDKSNDTDANLGKHLKIISVYLQMSFLAKKISHKSHEFKQGFTENLFFPKKMKDEDNFSSRFFFK